LNTHFSKKDQKGISDITQKEEPPINTKYWYGYWYSVWWFYTIENTKFVMPPDGSKIFTVNLINTNGLVSSGIMQSGKISWGSQ